MESRFSRTELVLGREALERLSSCRVAVFGVGGVGGYAVEALARAGVGKLDLVDSDTVSVSNINRQILALESTVGQSKVEVAGRRCLDINPSCIVTVHEMFYLPETAALFDFSLYDYVVDAVDTVTAKLDLALRAQEAGVPIISAMGAGNKLDPTKFRVSDIYQTTVDPLARVMRRECRKRGIRKLKVVWSEEEPVRLEPEAGSSDAASAEISAKKRIPGSVPFVPPVAGLVMASEVIKDLIGYPN